MKRASGALLSIGFLLMALWYFYSATPIKGVHVACNDITKGCGVDGWLIHFDRQPQMIKPFGIVAKLPEVELAYARFAMQGMEMGLNHYRLLPHADGSWTAEVILPICVRGRADWMMQLELKTAAGQKQYLIPFTTH